MNAKPLTWTVAGLLVLFASTARAQGPGGPGGRFGGGFPPSPVLQALDANGDGELSAQEIDNASAALRTLDKDKNGKLTADELRPNFGGPGPGPGGNPAELVNQLMGFDKNKDSKLAKDELPARLQPLMDRADTNKDGFLDKTELTRLAEAQLRRGPGPGMGREGDGPPGGRRQPPPRENP